MKAALRLLLVAALGLAGGCGPDEGTDWKAELRRLTNEQRGKVDPLPEVAPKDVVRLEIRRDPFRRD